MTRAPNMWLATRAARLVAVLALLCPYAAGCGDDDDDDDESVDAAPPTRDDVLDACAAYSEVACRAFGACLDWSQAEIDDCIAEEIDGCEPDIEDESCWAIQEQAFFDCFDVEDESCEELCSSGGFCFDFCPYVCPPS